MATGLRASAQTTQEAPAKPAAGDAAVKKLTATERLFKGRNKAWGYVIGQEVLLEEIGKQHPELKEKADATWKRVLEGPLGGAMRGVEIAMKKRFGAQFGAIEAKVYEQVRASLAKKKFKKDQSEAIIELIENYFNKVQLPHETLRYLASSDPAFLNNPVLEMKSGVKRAFTSKGNQKAKGVTLQMDFPMSWVILPPTEANGVWLAKNLAGYGRIASTLAVVPIPESVSIAEMKEGLKLPELKNLAPTEGKLVSARNAKIGGRDAGMLIFDLINPSFPGKEVPMRTVQLATLDEKTKNYLQFQFNVMVGPSNKGDLDQITKKMIPVFQQMIESVKFAE